MKPVVIEDPILNSPFEEPSRHFKFTDEGITDEVIQARRISTYFVPIDSDKDLAISVLNLFSQLVSNS